MGMRGTQRGFTLLETVVTLVIVGFAAVSISAMLTNVVNGMLYARSASASAENIQAAMTRITHELANMDTQRAITWGGNSVTYYYRTDAATTTIQLNGSTIQINNNTLLDNVTAFSLTFTQGNIAVAVSLTVNVPTPTATTAKTFSTFVNLNMQRFQ